MQDYYDDSSTFGSDDGFRFAFAFADGSTEDFSDPLGRDFAEYIELSGASW